METLELWVCARKRKKLTLQCPSSHCTSSTATGMAENLQFFYFLDVFAKFFVHVLEFILVAFGLFIRYDFLLNCFDFCHDGSCALCIIRTMYVRMHALSGGEFSICVQCLMG